MGVWCFLRSRARARMCVRARVCVYSHAHVCAHSRAREALGLLAIAAPHYAGDIYTTQVLPMLEKTVSLEIVSILKVGTTQAKYCPSTLLPTTA